MIDGDWKVVIQDFEKRIIWIKDDDYDLDIVMTFDVFQDFAKYIYSTYKKYKYVFERGRNERSSKK